MYTIWEIETQHLWLKQMPSQGEMADRKILFILAPIGFLWNNLWSVSRYVMGPLSGRWRQSGNDQQCLAAPIWKYRSGFGDHRFTFFIDLRPNYTFYTNLTNIVHWVVAYRDVAHLVKLNLGKSWEKSGKSFDAGLSNWIDTPRKSVCGNIVHWVKFIEAWGLFYLYGLPVIPAWINNHMPCKVGWNYLSIPKFQQTHCWSL